MPSEEDLEEEVEPVPPNGPDDRPKNKGGRPPKHTQAAGAGNAAGRYQWAQSTVHGRWGELCEILTKGSATDRALIHAPPGAGPDDYEIEVERVEPPGGGILPRIPGGAIYGQGKSPAAECYRYLVEHYHSRFRQRMGAVYECTVYLRGTNRYYLFRTRIALAPFEEIEDQMSGMYAAAVPEGAGARRALPREVGAGSAGAYGGGYGGSSREDALLRLLQEERERSAALMADMWKQLKPGAPLPPALQEAGAASAPSGPSQPVAPVALDVEAIVQATSRSILGMLTEAGLVNARAPVGAPSSAGAGSGHAAGYGPGLSGAVREQAGVSPRIASLRQELEEAREEISIRLEIRDMKREFLDDDEETPAAPGAGAAPGSTTSTGLAEEKPKAPYELTEIPGPKLYNQPVYHMKENEPATGFGESALRWSLRAPGVAQAIGSGLGKFVEGVGAVAIGKLSTSVAGFIDRMGASGNVQVGAGSGQGQAQPEVVSTTPPGAVDATPREEQREHVNGSASGAGGWPEV